jgi:hypothetical protein
MTPLEIRRFEDSDLRDVEFLNEPAQSCIRSLYGPSKNYSGKLWISETSYGQIIWSNQKINISDKHKFKNPIGIVLNGALEITESFFAGDVERKRTTAILRKGDFFGLFEAFGDLHGYWEITSGIQRFLIADNIKINNNSINSSLKNISQQLKRTLLHHPNADYDYSELINRVFQSIPDNKINLIPWSCKLVLFDLDQINDDPPALIYLQQAAVKQLVSWVRQNPSNALLPNTKIDNDNSILHQRFDSTLHGILNDDIPILSSYNPDKHDEYGPFKLIYKSINSSENENDLPNNIEQSNKKNVSIWIPEYWSRINKSDAIYLDILAKKFEFTIADSILKSSERNRILRSGSQISQIQLTNDGGYSFFIQTKNGIRASVDRFGVNKKKKIVPQSLQNIFQSGNKNDTSNSNLPLLGNGFLLRHCDDITK